MVSLLSPAEDVRVPQTEGFKEISTDGVEVIVGEALINFTLHKGLVVPRSEFFTKALNGPWKEAKSRVISLPEEEADTFLLYVQLLYTGTIPVMSSSILQIFDPATDTEYYDLSKLYVLAEMLIDDKTKGLVLAAILTRSEQPFPNGKLLYPDLQCVKVIYEGTPEESPARRLLVELYTEFIEDSFTRDELSEIPKDFLCDLSSNMLASRLSLNAQTSLEDNYAMTVKSLTTEQKLRKVVQDELNATKKTLKEKEASLAHKTKALSDKDAELAAEKKERDRTQKELTATDKTLKKKEARIVEESKARNAAQQKLSNVKKELETARKKIADLEKMFNTKK